MVAEKKISVRYIAYQATIPEDEHDDIKNDADEDEMNDTISLSSNPKEKLAFALMSVLFLLLGLSWFSLNSPSTSNSPNLLGAANPTALKWRNPPTHFVHEGNNLIVQVPGKTDYWRKTFYGFVRDSGPYYYQKVTGDFTATVKITGRYTSLFDQAGIMVRESANIWMKCGIEYTEGIQHASTVITRDFSDWSITPIPSNPESIWLKVTRTSETIETFYSFDGQLYTPMRLGYLSTFMTLEVGMVVAAPIGDGFEVVFEDFEIQPIF